MMTGNFTTMEPNFSAAGPHTLAVRGLNHLHRMRRAKYDGQSQRQDSVTDSEIAKSFDGLVDPNWKSHRDRRAAHPDADRHRPRTPRATSRASRLSRRRTNTTSTSCGGARASAAMSSRSGSTTSTPTRSTCTSVPPRPGRPRPTSSTWGVGLIDLKATLTTANQVKKVTVHGWDRTARSRSRKAPTGSIRS